MEYRGFVPSEQNSYNPGKASTAPKLHLTSYTLVASRAACKVLLLSFSAKREEVVQPAVLHCGRCCVVFSWVPAVGVGRTGLSLYIRCSSGCDWSTGCNAEDAETSSVTLPFFERLFKDSQLSPPV